MEGAINGLFAQQLVLSALKTRKSPLKLKWVSRRKGPREGHIISVLKLAPLRNPLRGAGGTNADFSDHPSHVERGRVPLNSGARGEDDFLY